LLLAESGDLDAFWRLNYWMLFEADGTSHITESYTDLTRLPGGQSADVQTQMRILEAAKHYLSQGDPATSEWLGTDKWDRRAVAGCRAFHLLYQMDSGYLNDLEPGIWRRWTPAIVAWHWGSESHVERALVQSAYKHAPKEVLEALQMLLGDGHSSNSAVRAVECIEDSWDTSIEEVFFNSLEQLGLLSESGRFLLRVLLRHNCEKARSLAEGEISSLSEPGSESFERALVAGTSLFFQSPDCGWPALWPAITTDDGFGRALVERIAREPLYGSETEFPNRLSEKDLAEFYILLEGLYPHAQHPALTRPWIPEGTVSGLKSHVLAGLRSRGTWRACEQLRRIAQAFPEIENLKWILVQAERTTRERTWVRVRPKDLLSLTRGSDKRLVRDGDELLEATIESLRRFEQHLHRANTPTIGRLWNQKPVTPKDESNLSNEVKMHLDEDLRRRGIIVNREVEVRSPAGGV
jgi:hypothetical protein